MNIQISFLICTHLMRLDMEYQDIEYEAIIQSHLSHILDV